MKHNVQRTNPDVSFARRIARKITLFLSRLAPPGFEDASGFHFGVEPRRQRPVRPHGRMTKNKLRPRPKTKAKPRTNRRFDYKSSPDSLVTLYAV